MSTFAEEMRAAGHSLTEWANAAGTTYPVHSHPYRKVLCCVQGSIVFHLAARDVTLEPGRQLVIDPGVEHSATVGPSGVRCLEAHVT